MRCAKNLEDKNELLGTDMKRKTRSKSEARCARSAYEVWHQRLIDSSDKGLEPHPAEGGPLAVG